MMNGNNRLNTGDEEEVFTPSSNADQEYVVNDTEFSDNTGASYSEQPGSTLYTEPQETSQERTTNSLLKKSKIKRLLVPIGIVVTIFLVYNILDWYSKSKTQLEEVNPQEEAIAQKQQEAMKAAAAETANDNQQAPAAVVNPPVTLQTVEQTTQKEAVRSSQEYQNMQQELTMVNRKLAATENTLLDLNAKMEELAMVVEELQKGIIQQKEAAEKAKQELLAKKSKPKARPIPVYHLKAIVPNRAWIESDEGITETVKVGDQLYGYGFVEIISPRQGLVVTSNGSVIQYGVNDY